MSTHFDALQNRIQPLREQLLNHAVYEAVRDQQGLQMFMEHHVAAVWDFMSLLKSLQRRLTCTTVPWVPAAQAHAVRILNEIVLTEESDEVEAGHYLSHFEIYLGAMAEVGAHREPMIALVQSLHAATSPDAAIQQLMNSALPAAAKAFSQTTFAHVQAPVHVSASSFLLGREDLVPQMFQRLIVHLPLPANSLFRFYLKRHIEVDGDSHGPLARQLLEQLCDQDQQRWDEATAAAIEALQARLLLWDSLKELLAVNAVEAGSTGAE